MIAAAQLSQEIPGIDPAIVDAIMADALRDIEERNKVAMMINPFKARGAALELLSSADPEVMIDGPAGTGKSRAALERLHRLMIEYAGSRALIVRKTRKSLSESALFTYEENVLRKGNPIVGNPGPSRQHRDKYVYPNGSEVVVGGLDNADRILGSEYDLVYIPQAEEITRDDRDALNSRLRHGVIPFQQLIYDANPSRPDHFLKELSDRQVIRRLKSVHTDNPRLWNELHQRWTSYGRRYMARLKLLTGVRYKRLVLGLWVKAEGAVYEEWDAQVHVVPWSVLPGDNIPSSWLRFITIDFGFRNPMVVQWWARSPDDRLYLYREIYATERLVEDVARQAKLLSTGERIGLVICDHDAEGRATWERHFGKATVAAKKRITAGIQRMQARLRPDKTGRPALFLLEDALVQVDPSLREAHLPVSTAGEFDGYIWADTPSEGVQRGVGGKPVREVPVDENNHGMDALRYAVAQWDLKVLSKNDKTRSTVRSNF